MFDTNISKMGKEIDLIDTIPIGNRKRHLQIENRIVTPASNYLQRFISFEIHRTGS